MEEQEITQAFDAAIAEAVRGANMPLNEEAVRRLRDLTQGAGRVIYYRVSEFDRPAAVEQGVAAYRKLVAKAVSQAKSMRQSRIDEFALDGAIKALGPEPPYWD